MDRRRRPSAARHLQRRGHGLSSCSNPGLPPPHSVGPSSSRPSRPSRACVRTIAPGWHGAIHPRASGPSTGSSPNCPPFWRASHPAEQYVLVGHSFGSFIVSAYAMRHPQRVAGVVLVDPATEWLTMTPHRARLVRGARHLSRIGALLAQVGVVRACLALLTVVRRARRGISSGSLAQLPHGRSNAWSGKCGSFHRTFTRSCRRSGATRNASTPWPITCWCSNATGTRLRPSRLSQRRQSW